MKIGFDAKRAFMNKSGLGSYSRNLLQGLFEFYPDHEYQMFTPGVSEQVIFDHPENAQRILPSAIWKGPLKSVWRSTLISTLAKKNKLDVYHGLSAELPLGIERAGCKSIVTIHDLIFKRYPKHYSKSDVMTHDKKVKYACRVADQIVAISEQTKRDLIEFYHISEDRIQVIYQSCSTSFYDKAFDSEIDQVRSKYDLPKDFILNVGSITERKNTLQLVKAYELSKTPLPLILIGGGKQYKDRVNQYIVDQNLEDQIKILSSVPDQDLPAIYQAAQLFVYPSLFEGFGIPILEAMQSGTPVVTSAGSCFKEVGGDAAIYADPFDVNDIAYKIIHVLNNSTKQSEMIQTGKLQAKKFTHEHLVHQWMELYQS